MFETQPRARIGTSGWNKEAWRGNFYPPGLAQTKQLGYAAARLATLEINTTFHGGGSVSSFLKWQAATPDDFVFSVKGTGVVTHDHSLRNPARGVAEFFGNGILGLGEKLGAVLWQTPPRLAFQPEVVEAFLAVLPHSVREAQHLIAQFADDPSQVPDVPDRPIRHALEVRHASFRNPAFIELLRRYRVAAVVTNSPGWPHFREVTADFVYLRLHGSLEHYPDGYDEAALEEWAGLIDGWRSGSSCPDSRGRDVFAYFDNPDHSGIRSPLDAMKLQRLLDGPDSSANRPPTVVQPGLW